jgi:DinB superfamily
MDDEEKRTAIEEFSRLAAAFDDTLALPSEVVLFRPFADAWSIVEQVVHCADFDIANFHRYRWGIVSPGTTVLSFDGSWTSRLNYQSTDLSLAIGSIKAVRMLMANHLRQSLGEDWTQPRYAFADGSGFTLEEGVLHYIRHVAFHRELIDRNLSMFGASQESRRE